MARVKRGVTSKAKHSKLREATKGYRMTRRRLVRKMKEATLHAGVYAYAGRKDKKGDMRQSWILRISEAVRPMGLNYSRFIKAMSVAKVELNRKVLAEILQKDPETFKEIVNKVKWKLIQLSFPFSPICS